MKLRSTLAFLGLMIGLLALALPAFADHHGGAAAAPHAGHGADKGKSEPSAQDRARMADAHQKMAECLRSTRPVKECRNEMKKAHEGWGHGGSGEHGKSCAHGESCSHCEDCPHCDGGDGSCKQHGDGHDAMSEGGKGAKGGKPDKAGKANKAETPAPTAR